MAAPARAHRTHFGTSLTRFVAPYGAPPNAPVVALACASRILVGTPFQRFVAPLGSSTKMPQWLRSIAPTAPISAHPSHA
eukprot:675351-Pyramimonas_sp.AAC.1